MVKLINGVLTRFEDAAMVACMAIATTLTVLQVVMRFIFNMPIFWAEEAVLHAIICMSFIGIGYGVRLGSHISVDILGAIVPQNRKRIIVILACGLGITFGLVLAYLGYRMAVATLGRGQLSPALRIPVAAIYSVIPLAGVMTTFRYALKLYQTWIGAPETLGGTDLVM
ncbi:MAG: TRAP transporter small permease [Devosia sp.]